MSITGDASQPVKDAIEAAAKRDGVVVAWTTPAAGNVATRAIAVAGALAGKSAGGIRIECQRGGHSCGTSSDAVAFANDVVTDRERELLEGLVR